MLGIGVARRPQSPSTSIDIPAWKDSRLVALLEEIEQEETPERLLKLATELQQQLLLSRQRLSSK
jgi:hypothetical protein